MQSANLKFKKDRESIKYNKTNETSQEYKSLQERFKSLSLLLTNSPNDVASY